MTFEFRCSALVTVSGTLSIEADSLEEAEADAVHVFGDALSEAPQGRGLELESARESDMDIELEKVL